MIRATSALLGTVCVMSMAVPRQARAHDPAAGPLAPENTPAAVAGRPSTAGRGPETDAGGITWVAVPAGTFEMGCVPGDGECVVSESPRHRVRISRPFQLMTTEVSVGMYRGVAKPPEQPVWNRDDTLPVVNVTWEEASSFCAAVGGRLPTEAEWEYAARGGRAGDRFVWGGAATPRIDGRPAANVADDRAKERYPYMTVFAGYDDGHPMTSPVGAYPPNGFGLCDMAGNAWEWVADWYDPGYYGTSPPDDPKGPASGDGRVVRGGSWYGDPASLRISVRGGDDPVRRPHGDGVGFRCARETSP